MDFLFSLFLSADGVLHCVYGVFVCVFSFYFFYSVQIDKYFPIHVIAIYI